MDHRFPGDDLDISGQIDSWSVLPYLALVLPSESRITYCMAWDTFPALDLYYTDAAVHLSTAGRDLDGLERVKFFSVPHVSSRHYQVYLLAKSRL